MSNSDELIRACRELQIDCSLLQQHEASQYINNVLQKYNPRKTSGHLAIGGDSISVPLEKYEFTYSQHLPSEPVYVFFDQDGSEKKKVLVINDGRQLCSVMEESFGMEYFVSNAKMDYLIVVNWYVIEGVGASKNWLIKLT
jgi:hypothetical protein